MLCSSYSCLAVCKCKDINFTNKKHPFTIYFICTKPHLYYILLHSQNCFDESVSQAVFSFSVLILMSIAETCESVQLYV